MTDKEFLKNIEAFLLRSDMSETAFGVKAVNDGNFVSRLRAGSSATLRTVEKVNKFMENYEQEAA